MVTLLPATWFQRPKARRRWHKLRDLLALAKTLCYARGKENSTREDNRNEKSDRWGIFVIPCGGLFIGKSGTKARRSVYGTKVQRDHPCASGHCGRGIVGTAVVRELSRYKLDLLLIEAEPEVGWGSTKANSGSFMEDFTKNLAPSRPSTVCPVIKCTPSFAGIWMSVLSKTEF